MKMRILQRGSGPARRPPFAAVDHVMIAVADDRRLDVGRIRRRDIRLGHREGRADLAAQQRLEPALLLRVGRVANEHFHVAGVRRVAVERLRRDPRPAHDLAQRRVFEVGEPGAEVGFRQEQVPQARRARLGLQCLHDLRRDPRIAAPSVLLHLGGEHGFRRVDVLVHEARDARGEVLHFGRVLEVHVNALRNPAVAPFSTRHRRPGARGFPARMRSGSRRFPAGRANARRAISPRCETC